jgi:ribonuclease P protein component
MKIRRTVSRELFGEVLKKGQVYHSALFSIRALSTPFSACTAVVSKKVIKTAVGRNTAKRRARDIVAGILEANKASYTAVIFIGKPIAGVSPVVLKESINTAFSKLGVF